MVISIRDGTARAKICGNALVDGSDSTFDRDQEGTSVLALGGQPNFIRLCYRVCTRGLQESPNTGAKDTTGHIRGI